MLDPSGISPLYQQLMQKIQQDIRRGQYRVGSRIPSEQELCETYGVSRITVRKALTELSSKGIVERQQGKGTFVSSPGRALPSKGVISFHELFEQSGQTVTSSVLRLCEVDGTKEDCASLGLNKGSRLVEIYRLRSAEKTKLMLELDRFSMAYSYLLDSDLRSSLYEILAQYGVEPKQAAREVSISFADPSQAKLLGVAEGFPLLFIEELVYDQKGRALHISKQWLRGDLIKYKL